LKYEKLTLLDFWIDFPFSNTLTKSNGSL